jgi:regulator of protease activity HflC (stomatin/prohibitin superfamily)
MSNGVLKKTGIGLASFKGPYDQVAKFPARVFKAAFTTEQVTLEMQGIKISGMLIWTINRVGNGPFNAYKTLGADLSSSEPRHANDTLVSMSSAIVRNCIANSTIEQMLRERSKVCQAIKKEMFEVVKGWGVWLETVEITDVEISSGQLFKDMQAEYREKMKKESEFYRLQVESEINEIRGKSNLVMEQKRKDANLERTLYKNKIDQEIAEEIDKHQAELSIIYQAKQKILNEYENWVNQTSHENEKALQAIEDQMSTARA